MALRVQFNYALYGLDDPNNPNSNVGKDLYKPYTSRNGDYGYSIGNGIKTNLYYSDVKISYLLNPKINLRLELGIINRINSECKILFVESFKLIPFKGHYNIFLFRIEGNSFALNRYDYEPVKVLKWFDKLLLAKKYEKSIYEFFIDYYAKNNNDSLNFYKQLLKSKYPESCNIKNLLELAQQSGENAFLENYNKCIANERISDSISANVLLATFYLNKREFNEVEKLIKHYYASDSNFSFSKLQTWERYKYFDINSRLLFLKGDYSGMIKFIFAKSEYNEIIKVETEEYFKNYLKTIYKDYFNDDTLQNNFEEFYKKKFKNFRDNNSG